VRNFRSKTTHAKKRQLTRLACVSRPPWGASAVEVAVGFAAHAFVLARRNGARVLHDLAVGAREALRAAALVLVGGGVFAGAAVQARPVGAAVVEI
jgi:hypothetical protein